MQNACSLHCRFSCRWDFLEIERRFTPSQIIWLVLHFPHSHAEKKHWLQLALKAFNWPQIGFWLMSMTTLWMIHSRGNIYFTCAQQNLFSTSFKVFVQNHWLNVVGMERMILSRMSPCLRSLRWLCMELLNWLLLWTISSRFLFVWEIIWVWSRICLILKSQDAYQKESDEKQYSEFSRSFQFFAIPLWNCNSKKKNLESFKLPLELFEIFKNICEVLSNSLCIGMVCDIFSYFSFQLWMTLSGYF